MQQLQENFCVEFVRCRSNAEAYKRAGYKVKSDKSAAVCATKLLKKPNIQARIAELRKELASGKIMDAAQRRELLTQFARDEETGRADRLRAIDLLNKMDGIYITKAQVSGVDGSPLTFRWEGGDG
jgi:phage terminase small subunit